MAAPHGVPIFVPVLLAALIAWRLYSRIRRSLGRQRLSGTRAWVTIAVYLLLSTALLLSPIMTRAGAGALAAAVAVGVGLGLYGLRLTRFEDGAEGLYYTPSAHLGIALSSLLVIRLGYRLAQGGVFGGATAGSSATPASVAANPLTLALIGALAGYYVTYAAGLLLERRRAAARRAAAAVRA